MGIDRSFNRFLFVSDGQVVKPNTGTTAPAGFTTYLVVDGNQGQVRY